MRLENKLLLLLVNYFYGFGATYKEKGPQSVHCGTLRHTEAHCGSSHADGPWRGLAEPTNSASQFHGWEGAGAPQHCCPGRRATALLSEGG
jgi:hypothetical protein